MWTSVRGGDLERVIHLYQRAPATALPTLQAQRDDAATKGQVGRVKVFDGLLARLDEEAS